MFPIWVFFPFVCWLPGLARCCAPRRRRLNKRKAAEKGGKEAEKEKKREKGSEEEEDEAEVVDQLGRDLLHQLGLGT